LDLALRHRADKPVDRPPVLEGVNRRDRLDAHLLRDLGVLVNVELDHADRAVGAAHDPFQDRAQLLAGAAPGRPEIDDDRLVERGVDDLGHETSGGYILDGRGRAGTARPRATDQRFIRHGVLLLSGGNLCQNMAAARGDDKRRARSRRTPYAPGPASPGNTTPAARQPSPPPAYEPHTLRA